MKEISPSSENILTRPWLLIPLLAMMSLAFVFVLQRQGANGGGFAQAPPMNQEIITLQWQDLLEMDYKSGVASAQLKKADRGWVRVPGFVVPLSDNLETVSEFLLVPDPMACIHLPPPPPNQMVYVKFAKAVDVPASFDPIWVLGRFSILETTSQYGESSFQVDAVAIEPYEWKE